MTTSFRSAPGDVPHHFVVLPVFLVTKSCCRTLLQMNALVIRIAKLTPVPGFSATRTHHGLSIIVLLLFRGVQKVPMGWVFNSPGLVALCNRAERGSVTIPTLSDHPPRAGCAMPTADRVTSIGREPYRHGRRAALSEMEGAEDKQNGSFGHVYGACPLFDPSLDA